MHNFSSTICLELLCSKEFKQKIHAAFQQVFWHCDVSAIAPTTQKINMMKCFHLFFIPTCERAHAHNITVVQQNLKMNEEAGIQLYRINTDKFACV